MGDAKTLETVRGVTRRERATGVGARVREARLEIGLTQGGLGGSRFSKEYVSQVELGKTRPSPAALDWFAERLGVDRMALAGESPAAIRPACETTVDPSDALRARIFNARAKIRRRQKDFTAAAEDVEQALELAHALNDDRVLAETYLDASLVAERRNEYTRAREHAERSKALFERVADHEYVGKLLNNLGQLRAITGKPEEAVPLLGESFRIAVEQDNRIDAAFAASSLASARMHSGDLEGAIESGYRAIELLSSREEYREEEGNAQIVIGRASLALGRLEQAEVSFKAAADCFAAVETVSH